MSIQKTSFNVGETNLTLGMPISKVDLVNRLVSGFATLDNTDVHDEVVESTASANAFARFRGNIREMHQPIAAGRMVDFRQEAYYDTKTEKFYEGIYVTVYVSLGAEDTWQKVIDGTLSGFSIGGEILDAKSQYVSEIGKVVRFINDYELIELSLVDNPANQLANVFSIVKSADGNIMKGMIAEAQVENVYYCRADEIVKTSTEDSVSCPNCNVSMENAGWFEYDKSNKAEKLKDVVQKYLITSDITQGKPAQDKGGVDVVVENKEEADDTKVDEVLEVAPITDPDEVPAVEVEPKDEEVAASVSEVDNADDDLAKMFDGLKDSLAETLQKNTDTISDSLKGIDERFETVTKDFEGKYSELAEKNSKLGERLAGIESTIGNVEKSLGILEGATAVRKSNDLGGSEEHVIEKSVASKWGGHFIGTDSLQD